MTTPDKFDKSIARIDALRIPQNIDWDSYYSKMDEVEDVHGAEEYKQAVIERMYGKLSKAGVTTPFPSLNDKLRFRPCEYSTWTGWKGCGKSMLLSQMFLHSMTQGERCLVISPEFRVEVALMRMVKQAGKCREPSERFIEHWLDWCAGRLWFLDVQGNLKPRTILGVIAYCARKLKVTQVIVDSLMKCGIAPSDYDGQADFVSKLQSLSHKLGPHIHLVTHGRKRGDAEKSGIGLHDTKGSSEINDLAENSFFLETNEHKRRAIESGEALDLKVLEAPDQYLKVAMQRNGDWVGAIPLWRHADSFQFVEHRNARPFDYAPGWNGVSREPGED